MSEFKDNNCCSMLGWWLDVRNRCGADRKTELVGNKILEVLVKSFNNILACAVLKMTWEKPLNESETRENKVVSKNTDKPVNAEL